MKIKIKVEMEKSTVPIYQVYDLPKGKLIRLHEGINIPVSESDEETMGIIGYFYEADGDVGFFPLEAEGDLRKTVTKGMTISYKGTVLTIVEVDGRKPNLRALHVAM